MDERARNIRRAIIPDRIIESEENESERERECERRHRMDCQSMSGEGYLGDETGRYRHPASSSDQWDARKVGIQIYKLTVLIYQEGGAIVPGKECSGKQKQNKRCIVHQSQF